VSHKLKKKLCNPWSTFAYPKAMVVVCHFSGVARASDKSIHNLIFNFIQFDFAIRHEVQWF